MTRDQRLDLLVIAELDVRHPAPAKRRDEHLQLGSAFPDRCPVRLHLLAAK